MKCKAILEDSMIREHVFGSGYVFSVGKISTAIS